MKWTNYNHTHFPLLILIRKKKEKLDIILKLIYSFFSRAPLELTRIQKILFPSAFLFVRIVEDIKWNGCFRHTKKVLLLLLCGFFDYCMKCSGIFFSLNELFSVQYFSPSTILLKKTTFNILLKIYFGKLISVEKKIQLLKHTAI